MAKSTPATLALEKAGVAFELHEYDYDPNAARIGMQAAEALGIEPARLLKTLMARADKRNRLRAGAVRPRGESEEARLCRRRQERGHAGRGRGRAHHRLSRRRHLAVRPEEARARVRRAVGARLPARRLQRRPPRLAGGTGAGGSCCACSMRQPRTSPHDANRRRPRARPSRRSTTRSTAISVLVWGLSWIAMHYQVGAGRAGGLGGLAFRHRRAIDVCCSPRCAASGCGSRSPITAISSAWAPRSSPPISRCSITPAQHVASGLLVDRLLARLDRQCRARRRSSSACASSGACVIGGALGVAGVAAMFYPELGGMRLDAAALIGLVLQPRPARCRSASATCCRLPRSARGCRSSPRPAGACATARAS